MLEPQIRGIEAEVRNLRAQLDNQGLGAQFTDAIVGIRTAISALREAVLDLQTAMSTPAVPPPPTEPVIPPTPLKRTVPPDAPFFQGQGPVKPIEPDQSTAAVVD